MVYLQITLIVLLPLLLLELQKIKKWFKAIVMAYALGIVVGNVWPEFFVSDLLKEITGISIILAIPLMLFPSRVKDWVSQPKTLLLAYGLAVISTTITVVIAWFVFKNSLSDISVISGMIEGVYTGGTVNLNAIGLAFNAPNSLLVLLNGYDMFFSAIYLLTIFSFLPKLLSFVLPKSNNSISNVVEEKNEFNELTVSLKSISLLKSILLAILVLGFVAGVSVLLTGGMNELVLVFGVSVVAILLSFSLPIRNLPGNMILADYLMMIFGFSLGAQASISDIVSDQNGLLGYFIMTYLLMLVIHLILSKIFKIDVDTFIVSSTAAVFGPPFIGPVSESINNRNLIGPGIIVALMGNAIGTYLGIVVVELLQG